MSFAKILFLVFVFQNLECFQASNSYANLTLITAIEHFNEQLVDTIVREFNLDPNGKLHEILPVARTIANASLTRLAECYDNTVGDEELDIFHEPLGVIVHKFFTNFFRHLLENKSLEEVKNRIKALLDSVQYVGKRVIECALNLDPEYKPTKLGLTPLSAYTDEEFSGMMLPSTTQVVEPKSSEIRLGAISANGDPSCNIGAVPSEVYGLDRLDWREKGVVTPVQNQQQCGACYVFTAVGALESAYLLNNVNISTRDWWNSSIPVVSANNQQKFSEKSFLDCTQGGCGGGMLTEIWKRAVEYGVSLENHDAREYNQQKGECQNDPIYTKATGFCTNFFLANENELKAMIANYGPTAVAIYAAHPDFSNLRGKWEQNCLEPEYAGQTNHNVLVVGWDENYWIIKNSWGEDWGVDGFLYLARSVGKNCGIFTLAGVPFFNDRKPDGKPEQTNIADLKKILSDIDNGHNVHVVTRRIPISDLNSDSLSDNDLKAKLKKLMEDH